MDSNNNENNDRKEDQLHLDFLDDLIDRFEAYKIMSEVFYEYVPEKERVKALAQAAERIDYEIKKVSKYE